jgi:hypothetical protein
MRKRKSKPGADTVTGDDLALFYVHNRLHALVRSGVRHVCGAALWIGQWLIAQRPSQRGALASPRNGRICDGREPRALAPLPLPDIGGVSPKCPKKVRSDTNPTIRVSGNRNADDPQSGQRLASCLARDRFLLGEAAFPVLVAATARTGIIASGLGHGNRHLQAEEDASFVPRRVVFTSCCSPLIATSPTPLGVAGASARKPQGLKQTLSWPPFAHTVSPSARARAAADRPPPPGRRTRPGRRPASSYGAVRNRQARVKRAAELTSITSHSTRNSSPVRSLFRVGLHPLLGWCRARRHDTSRLLADVTDFLFSECRIGAGRRGGAELGGRPQPPGRRKKSCSAASPAVLARAANPPPESAPGVPKPAAAPRTTKTADRDRAATDRAAARPQRRRHTEPPARAASDSAATLMRGCGAVTEVLRKRVAARPARLDEARSGGSRSLPQPWQGLPRSRAQTGWFQRLGVNFWKS